MNQRAQELHLGGLWRNGARCRRGQRWSAALRRPRLHPRTHQYAVLPASLPRDDQRHPDDEARSAEPSWSRGPSRGARAPRDATRRRASSGGSSRVSGPVLGDEEALRDLVGSEVLVEQEQDLDLARGERT